MESERDKQIAHEEFVDETGEFTHYEKFKSEDIRLTDYVAKNKLKSGNYVYGPDLRGIYYVSFSNF